GSQKLPMTPYNKAVFGKSPNVGAFERVNSFKKWSA
ncbi:MAG: hypothetical protein ACI82O_002543, partial [Patiriisocius sp.]